jgi:hypothetical protein
MGDRKVASVASSFSMKTELVLDQKKNEPRDLVSLTNLCHTIMNSAAFLYID